MSDKEWLSKLKAGDKVIVEGTGTNSEKGLGVVSRFTQNFIIVKRGGFESKYKKINGMTPGSSYYGTMLREATSEALAKLEEEHYRNVFSRKLNSLSWTDVPLDKIKQIRELVEPYIKKKGENI